MRLRRLLRARPAGLGVVLLTLASLAMAAAPLPEPELVRSALRGAPAVRAAADEQAAAAAGARQLALGEPAWQVQGSTARRSIAGPPVDRGLEWDLALQRTVRLPGKAQVQAELGAARQRTAATAAMRTWREQGRLLLDLWGRWLREGENQRMAEAQLALLLDQQRSVDGRLRAGSASALEQRQAAAATALARAQLATASARAASARGALAARFPALAAASQPGLPGEVPPPAPADWNAALQAADTELALALDEAAAAEAAGRVDAAERQPDPSVALRVGQARDRAERFVGLAVAVPLGSGARDAAAEAARARALAARRRADDAALAAAAAAAQQIGNFEAARSAGLAGRDATQALDAAAEGVARAWALGEGSLADLLAARRIAQEQRQAATQAVIDAWLARWRIELDLGVLWPAD